MPEIVKKQFEERTGYANYYFNRAARERTLDAWLARRTPAGGDQAWSLAAQTGDGTTCRLEISDAGCSLELPQSRYDWTASDDLAENLLPEGSGGMLPALYLWRYLATKGPEEFGEVSYWGAAPFPGCDEPTDVIVAIRRGLEVWFYFAPQDGHLVGLELWTDHTTDPCEIRLTEPREATLIPGRLEVFYGDIPFAVLKLDAP